MASRERLLANMREGPAAGSRPDQAPSPLPRTLSATEARLYERYGWCLNAFPTVAEIRPRLRDEIASLEHADEPWHRDEVATNVFLLSCALLDSVDDDLAAGGYDFSRVAVAIPGAGIVVRGVESLLAVRRRHRDRQRRGLLAWRADWSAAVDAFLQAWLTADTAPAALAGAAAGLVAPLGRDLPADVLARRAQVPAAFRTQDLTHHDGVEMASRFADELPDRARSLLVVGLRTAGSYFAPLVRASLAVRGYREVDAVTLRPKRGITAREKAALARCASRGGLALVVDEPPDTGGTLAKVVDLLRAAGVPARDVVVVVPIHPTRRNWNAGYESLPLHGIRVLSLDPADWHKEKLLAEPAIAQRLEAYFRERGYTSASLVASPEAAAFNDRLRRLSEEKFHTRLKRVYEVRLRRADGAAETRYVLAKSVGWGWLGYHAFLAARAVAEFVPPVLGLRDGILYTEWLPQEQPPTLPGDRAELLRRASAYVAARARSLRLNADIAAGLEKRYLKGHELLAAALGGAYGSKPAALLKRSRLQHELARTPSPFPTLIDGKMRLQEWVRDADGALLKTDFEHHGLGKTELNVTDPAYDLADAILHLGLSSAEEHALLDAYRKDSGDERVEERLLLHKLLAGTAAMGSALDNLRDPRLAPRHAEFNQSYIEARDFLTTQLVRFSGRRCGVAGAVEWGSPLVVLDLDGVLDKQIFGFPSTTAAGVEAMRLLHAHGFALTLNTARTLAEVQEYARAYGCVGGVAEYGSVVWDGRTGRTRVLVTPASRDELQRVANALRAIPGVFLNGRYEHSLRAFTYQGGRTVPLPTALVQGLLAQLGTTRVTLHQTYLDTTLLATEVDKGTGLLALLRLAQREGVETVAIGDSEADLAMFRVATRSYAPSHISGRAVARLLGCRIVDGSYQRGLLSAARRIVHPDGARCPRCAPCAIPATDALLWQALTAADRRPVESLLRALADPMALETFAR